MKVIVYSTEAGVRIEIKVGEITSCRESVYIDGSAADGHLYTVSIEGTDLDGMSFVQLLTRDDDDSEWE